MSQREVRDQPQRDRIRSDLTSNLLVEAGAGSGKTTALLTRLLALVETGSAEIHRIAAVTFTRKAAAELRERFQTMLEEAILKARRGDGDSDGAAIERLETALHDIDRGFIGTIHAFCARLLRERPLEARLDPSFREVFGAEEERLRQHAWDRHLERLVARDDDSLEQLHAINIEPSTLDRGYRTIVEQPDVTFPADVHDPPAAGALRGELEELVDAAVALLPRREPDRGWDNLQTKVRRLAAARRTGRWHDDAFFFDNLAQLIDTKLGITYIRWEGNRDAIRPVKERFDEFIDEHGAAAVTLRQWRAYRYKIVLDFIQRAAAFYAAERRRLGVVTFNDLLMDAVGLLRRNPSARREFGQRYRYLLVDEFQDTDPVQAELIFLLAAAEPDADDWREATPRPGALFVVGDPKQSIYRFRRADIDIYNQVKERFERHGAVLTLTTNFRSQPPIETLVNGAFEGLFPARATPHQAAFAPLNAHRDDDVPRGAFCYEIPCASTRSTAVAAADAAMVASWIRQRIDAGERSAGDFMILTRRKAGLSYYGSELEKRAVPCQVTGAGVDISEQLNELVAVLRALNDPHDPVLAVSALVGMFFGIDHEQLAAHRLDDPRAETMGSRMFDFTAAEFEAPADDAGPVDRALSRLRRWWLMTLRLPADVAVGAIVDDLGLFPFLAGSEAGSSNAGALAYVMNAIRRAAINGDSSLGAALDALDEALRDDEVEAPLQPGRDDVVRVMNVHKAKGLEANVVILAHPTAGGSFAVRSVVQRAAGAPPRGAFVVAKNTGLYQSTTLAAPLDWRELAAAEAPYNEAEDDRLAYVAATRARQELLVSWCEKTLKKSPWRRLYGRRDELLETLDITVQDPPERASLDPSADAITADIDALVADRRSRSAASYEITSVSKLIKHKGTNFAVDGGGLGRAWGNAVHQALEAAHRGGDEAVRAQCRAALLDNDFPAAADGEPADLDDLVQLVDAVRRSDIWQRAQDARARLVEVPFALATNDATIVEGVIDLAFEEDDGWVIADYKTDVVDDPAALDKRRPQYRAQVEAYADYFERISGATVKERCLLWVGMGLTAEVW